MIYLWAKVIHLVFLVAWFAGMFYIWRLYVYHNSTSESSVKNQLAIMEKKLYYVIMLPASIVTITSGLYMLVNNLSLHRETWFAIKLLLIILLGADHLLAGYYRKQLLQGKTYSPYFFRLMNEVPTVLLIGIIIMIIIKPF